MSLRKDNENDLNYEILSIFQFKTANYLSSLQRRPTRYGASKMVTEESSFHCAEDQVP
jgi:hypothetical protein